MYAPPLPPRRPRWLDRGECLAWLIAFASILFGIRLYFIGTYGNATPFWDQWAAEAHALYKPFIQGRLAWERLVAPHVVHRIFTSRVALLSLFAANGTWNPLLQMVTNSALWVGTLAILVVLYDRATGHRHLPVLLAFALVAFGLPYGNENMLCGFQGCFYFFLFWSAMALHGLALTPPLSAPWWAGLACAVLALVSIGSGPLTAAAACTVAVTHYVLGVRRDGRQIAAIGLLAVVFLVGFLLTPREDSTARLGARSLADALNALVMTASWPLKIGFLGPLITYAPSIALAGVILRRPPPAGDARWFLFAMCTGCLGQTAAIAYGRAGGALASRYLDLFVAGLLANFAAALAVTADVTGSRRPRAVVATVAWTCVMLLALGVHTHRHAATELASRRDTAAAQQEHVRRYVLTGDISHLRDKPLFDVPYPEPDTLAKWLDDPVIRSFLPAVIAPPLGASEWRCDPGGAFDVRCTAPNLPARDEPLWSSHGTSGPEATGTAAISFSEPHRGYTVQVPFACGGDVEGITIEVEQDGERRRVPIPADAARATWLPVRIRVRGAPFVLHVADLSPTGWVTVASPVVEGRFDGHVRHWLARWDRFVIGGIVLVMALVVRGDLGSSRT